MSASIGLTGGSGDNLKTLFVDGLNRKASVDIAMSVVTGSISLASRAGVGVGGKALLQSRRLQLGHLCGSGGSAVWDGTGKACCFGTKRGPRKCKKSGELRFW